MVALEAASPALQIDTDTLEPAARTARRTGAVVHVVLPRAPGVTAQLREVAERQEVAVAIEVTETGTIAHFA